VVSTVEPSVSTDPCLAPHRQCSFVTIENQLRTAIDKSADPWGGRPDSVAGSD